MAKAQHRWWIIRLCERILDKFTRFCILRATRFNVDYSGKTCLTKHDDGQNITPHLSVCFLLCVSVPNDRFRTFYDFPTTCWYVMLQCLHDLNYFSLIIILVYHVKAVNASLPNACFGYYNWKYFKCYKYEYIQC